MKKFGFVFFIAVIFLCCKNKKTNLTDDSAAIKPNEFISAFKPLESNFIITDSNAFNDFENSEINAKLITRFCSENVLHQLTNNNSKATLYALGRVSKSTETYLLVLSVANKSANAWVLVFDKQNKFITQKQLADFGKNETQYKYSLTVNKEPTFFINKIKNTSTSDIKYTKQGIAYVNNIFMEVSRESNESKAGQEPVINPIEAMLALNPYSADYELDDRNFISIRDGHSKNDYIFFLHIEKNEGNCIGELKGDMQMKDSTTAVYNAAGDPCNIDFTFSNRVITVKEKANCGNRRGLDCQFDDAFLRKKTDPKKLSRKPLITVPTPEIKTTSPVKEDIKKLNPNKSIIKQVLPKEVTAPDNKPKKTTKPKVVNKEAENPYGN